jgi:hypothetical protein
MRSGGTSITIIGSKSGTENQDGNPDKSGEAGRMRPVLLRLYPVESVPRRMKEEGFGCTKT